MISTQLQKKRRLIDGKIIVGIDPAKAKHQAAVIDPAGDQVRKSFSFDVTTQGYTTTLWEKLLHIVPNCNPQSTDFAIETSCNLWITLASYLHSEGYRVLLGITQWRHSWYSVEGAIFANLSAIFLAEADEPLAHAFGSKRSR